MWEEDERASAEKRGGGRDGGRGVRKEGPPRTGATASVSHEGRMLTGRSGHEQHPSPHRGWTEAPGETKPDEDPEGDRGTQTGGGRQIQRTDQRGM